MKKTLFVLLVSLLVFGLVTPILAGDRTVVRIGRDITIDADERADDVVAIGGDIRIYGMVRGDAVAVGGSVYLEEDAEVHGDAVAVGGDIYEEEGSYVRGDIVEVDAFNWGGLRHGFHFGGSHFWGWPWGFKVLGFIGCLALGLILAVLLPKQLDAVSGRIRKTPLPVLGYGFIGILLVVPVLIVLAISIVGILLIPIELAAVVFFGLFGYYAVARVIGDKLSQSLGKETPVVLLSLLLGLILLGIVDIIPFFGDLVGTVAVVMGFGAVLMAIHKREKK
jgi:hypothetical protein